MSEDGKAATVSVPVEVSEDSATQVATIEDLRAEVADHAPAGLDVQVTGGPAFGADIASAVDGAEVTLLAVTIGVVALLLLLTYRSPVLWLVPLTVVGIADQVAGRVTAAVGETSGLPFDAGIVSVLVFGAGTNYALLLISRYREELHEHDDHRVALRAAWRATVPAIVASNATVVLALATLLLAAVPGTRGLGLASAVGLVIALAAVVLVLPAALAIVGRRVFWPFVPRPGDDLSHEGIWARVARRVVRRPAVFLAGSLGVLVVLASGLLGARVGLSQADSFRTASESADGLVTVGEHFPAGSAAPFVITTDASRTDAVTTAVEAVPGEPVRQSGQASFAAIIGPFIGMVVALGVAKAQQALVRDGIERQRLIASLYAAQEESAALTDELARVQRAQGVTSERTRLSRDIHDGIAQGFSSLLLLARAARAEGDADRRSQLLEHIESGAAQGLEESRRIVGALAPADLDEGSLSAAVRWVAERFADETGVAATVTASPTLPAVPTTVEVALLRLVQGALANVRTHAAARTVTVSLEEAGTTVRVDVVDDGVGFDPQGWWDQPSPTSGEGGYGLRATRARLRELSGGLSASRRPARALPCRAGWRWDERWRTDEREERRGDGHDRRRWPPGEGGRRRGSPGDPHGRRRPARAGPTDHGRGRRRHR